MGKVAIGVNMEFVRHDRASRAEPEAPDGAVVGLRACGGCGAASCDTSGGSAMMLAALAGAGGGQVRLFTDILGEIRPRLQTAFGTRLRGVVLYGSRARGEAAEDSDLDLMVLLAGPINLGRDIDITVQALYPLQLEVDYPIHAMPADMADFEAQEFGVYRLAKREGIPL